MGESEKTGCGRGLEPRPRNCDRALAASLPGSINLVASHDYRGPGVALDLLLAGPQAIATNKQIFS